jgi:hypothetical protein
MPQLRDFLKDKTVLKLHKKPKCDICLSHGSEMEAVYEQKLPLVPGLFYVRSVLMKWE